MAKIASVQVVSEEQKAPLGRWMREIGMWSLLADQQQWISMTVQAVEAVFGVPEM